MTREASPSNNSSGNVLGLAISQLRAVHGETQTQFAARIGLTASGLSRLETGVRQPSPETLGELSAQGLNLRAIEAGQVKVDRRTKIAQLAGELGMNDKLIAKLQVTQDINTALEKASLHYIYGSEVAGGIQAAIDVVPDVDHRHLMMRGIQLAVEELLADNPQAQAAFIASALTPRAE